MAKKFSNKQIAMSWIAGKLAEHKINPEKHELDPINGESLSPKQVEDIKAEVIKLLGKIRPKYEEFCTKQGVPILSDALEMDYRNKEDQDENN